MCVIAANFMETPIISDDDFESMWDTNPDGFGMMWVEESVLQTFHTLFIEDARKKYHEVHDAFSASSNIVIHFRIGTSGPNDLTNCHPFNITDQVGFVHNGILPGTYHPKKEDTRNDTRIFNDVILKKLGDIKEALANKATRLLLTDDIMGDKMVFLDNDNHLTFLNKDKGSVQEGVWYSNLHWDYVPTTQYIPVKYSGNRTCSKCKASISEYSSYDMCFNCRTSHETINNSDVCSSCGTWVVDGNLKDGKCKYCTCDAIDYNTCDSCGETVSSSDVIWSTRGTNTKCVCEECLNLMSGKDLYKFRRVII